MTSPSLSSNSSSLQDEDVFEAERLMRKRGRGNKIEYLVKWKNWSPKHNTWEPLGNILDRRLIDQFENEQKRLKRQRLDSKPNKSIDTSDDETRDKQQLENPFDRNHSYDKRDNHQSDHSANVKSGQKSRKLIEELYLLTESSNEAHEKPKLPKTDLSISQEHRHFDQISRNSFRTGWSGSENTESENESFYYDQNRQRRSDADCQSIDSFDEENVFVSNYGRCLRRTPARASNAAAALCSGELRQGRTGSAFDDYFDPSKTLLQDESLASFSSSAQLFRPKVEEDEEDEEDEKKNEGGHSEKSSRTCSPIRWLPPPELWTSRGFLDQIVVTDVISDFKITVKECRTKHGFFRNFPPKTKPKK